MTTIEENRQKAIELFNLERIESIKTWTAETLCDKFGTIICHDEDASEIMKSILKGGNLIMSVKHPKTTDMIVVSGFKINFVKKGE